MKPSFQEVEPSWKSGYDLSSETLRASRSDFEASSCMSIEDLLKDGLFDTKPVRANDIVYNDYFISNNFGRVKFSHNDLKNLSLDFSDQTLGGHRIYKEEVIGGRRAKTYQYTIKVIRFCGGESGKYEKKSSKLMVENNLLVPNKDLLGVLKPKHAFAQKRGRPRKYPVGLEPYKLKKKSLKDAPSFSPYPNYLPNLYNGEYLLRSGVNNAGHRSLGKIEELERPTDSHFPEKCLIDEEQIKGFENELRGLHKNPHVDKNRHTTRDPYMGEDRYVSGHQNTRNSRMSGSQHGDEDMRDYVMTRIQQ